MSNIQPYVLEKRETLLSVKRVCQECKRERALLFFPKTPLTGAYSKICQLCTTRRREGIERSLAVRAFRKRLRLTPLKETAIGPWRAK